MRIPLYFTLTLGLLVGCPGGDGGLKSVPNQASVTISTPSTGSTFPEGQPVVFEALVTYEGDFTNLTHTWVTGNFEMCAQAVVPGDGLAPCSYAFTEVGSHTVTVTVSDGIASPATATIDVQIVKNSPPGIEILKPKANDTFEPGAISLSAVVTDDEDKADALVVSVRSSVQGALPISATPVTSGDWADQVSLQKGAHQLTFTVTDSVGATAQDTVDIVVNTPPGPCQVEISPASPVSGEQLSVNMLSPSTDADGDNVTYQYDWTKDSLLFSSGTPVVPSQTTVRDQFWEVTVTPFDDVPAAGNPCTASVIVDNSPPRIDTVTVGPSNANTNDDLLAVGTGWFDQDGDLDSYIIRWFIDTGGGMAQDPVEITDTFPAAKTSRGDMLQAEFTPRDVFDQGIAVLSPTVTIANAPPGAPTVSIAPTRPDDSVSLKCNIDIQSVDADGDPVTYLYEWYRNGVLFNDTDNTINPIDTTTGDSWECNVLADDGSDVGPAGIALVAIVDNIAPDKPTIDPVDDFRNDDFIDLTGTCEPGCQLTFTCEDSTSPWVIPGLCSNVGTFSEQVLLVRGQTTSCSVVCEDSYGNVSVPSAPVTTQVCTVPDTYEDTTGSGDLPQSAIGQWAALPDDGSATVTIIGNILDGVDKDWFKVSTTDNITNDIAAGFDNYRFYINVTQGKGLYTFMVYRGSYAPIDTECSSQLLTGYDEYTDYAEDLGNADHQAPTTPQDCGSSSPLFNDCTDFSTTYYISVMRDPSQPLSCAPYELTITNGAWP